MCECVGMNMILNEYECLDVSLFARGLQVQGGSEGMIRSRQISRDMKLYY